VIICAVGVNSKRVIQGACQTYPPVMNFNITQFMGKWFEIYRFENGTNKNDCVRSEFAGFSDTTFSFIETARVLSPRSDSRVNGTVTVSTLLQGRLSVHFEGSATDEEVIVMATDYETFLMLWDCTQINATASLEGFSLLLRPTVKYTSADVYLLLAKTVLGTRFNATDFKPTIQDERCNSSAIATSVSAVLLTIVLIFLRV